MELIKRTYGKRKGEKIVKRRNLITAITAAAMMTVAMSMSAYAGQWQQSETGRWYDNGDGTWAHSGWYWIDGNNDGVAECYFFDQNGYMLTNTHTADGFWLNADGAWTVDGVVQTRSTLENNNTATDTTQTYANGDITFNSDNGGYNNRGCSNVALEMMNNTREENVRFGEVEVIDSGATIGLPGRGDYTVIYANGFSIYYPTAGVSGYKSLGVSPDRTDLDDTYLFKYYVDGIWGEEAAQHLYRNGFAETRSGEYCYSLGTDCRIKVGSRTLQWGENYAGSYIELR